MAKDIDHNVQVVATAFDDPAQQSGPNAETKKAVIGLIVGFLNDIRRIADAIEYNKPEGR